MEVRYPFQILKLLTVTLLVDLCSCHRLMLIDEGELLKFKPVTSWQFILQNPFEGNVILKESESDRFQVLFNISGNGDSLDYKLKKDLDALRIVLGSSQKDVDGSVEVGTEALNFLYIYAIGVACLVGLSTASGLLFLICWGGSRRHRSGSHGAQNRARESDTTKMPLLVSEPNTPHVNKHQFSETDVADAVATFPRHTDTATQKRWIHPASANYIHNSEEDDLVTNTLPTRGSASIRPAGILKRTSAGSSVSSAGGSSLDRSSIHSSIPPPVPLASSRCSDSNTDLDSNDSRKLGSVTSTTSSRPRHIARDFLDESAMSGRTGVRRPNPTPVSQPAMIVAAAAAAANVPSIPVTNVGKEAPSPLPEPPQFESGFEPGFMYRGGMSSAQGSDETSGIISDSDVSSLERQQQSQSSTSSSNNKLSSSLGGTSTIGTERFISLDSNDERYIALNVPVSSPTPEVPTSSTTSSGVSSNTPSMDMTIPRRSSAGTAVATSGGSSTPTLRPIVGSYTSSSTLSSASSVQTVLAADDMMGNSGGTIMTGTSSLGRPFRHGISPVPPKRSVSLKGSTSFGEGGLEHAGEEDDNDPPLPPPPPSSTTSPRSALKGSRPPGPPINKQLRFTTITLLALLFLVSCAFGSIVKPAEKSSVDITIFLPKALLTTSKELTSIILYLNKSSHTKVDLGKYPRQRVEIYDMVDANHYVSKAECSSRYSCHHTCDYGLGYKCICERGYELMDHIRCKDTNECLQDNHPCTENRKKCTNLPGHYACDCPLDAKGLACGDCGSLCKPGFFIWQNCTENQPRVCKGCNPLCRSDQYEFMPCTRTTNRKCRTRIDLPGIRLPFKDNIWYEDLSRVVDASTPNMDKTPENRTLILDRGSGYTVKLKFVRDLKVAPVLEPEDHSRANDNNYFRPTKNKNKTLKDLCPYPLTKFYELRMTQHNNVMSLATMDHTLPGYKPTLRPCRTYRLFSRPPQVKNGVPCVQPGRLPGLFGREKNNLLAEHHGIYVEQQLHCYRKSQECQRCLHSCVLHMNKTASCRPSTEPGDNGLSPRLVNCFNCCSKDNCTNICKQYFRPNCKPKLCMNGSLLEFELRPTWDDTMDGRRFYCHMRLRQREPVYHLQFWLYRENVQLNRQPFTAVLHPTSDSIKPQTRNNYHFLTANYLTGLSELPSVVSGEENSQSGYVWNDKPSPLLPGVGRSSMHRAEKRTGEAIKVWTRTPMALNSALWSRLTCDRAEKSLELLNENQNFDPLIPITQVRVDFAGKYQYRVSKLGFSPKVNFTIPQTASVLSALFKRTYVHRGDYLRADLIFDRSSGQGGYQWIVRVSGAVAAKPGLFRIQLFQVVQPVGEALYDYEVGVYQERRFQLEFIIPAPNEEPRYTKAFKVLITDTKGTMELHVERPPQNAKELESIRRFEASTVPRPDVFPSVAVKSYEDNSGLNLLGVRDRLWWGVLGVIVILCLLLLVGHLTEPSEMILGRKESSKQAEYSSDPSCQHRLLFMIYVVLKAGYSFAVTLTAFLIVARLLTDLPDNRPSSYENFFSNITVHEKLLLDKMDLHLTRELSRQRRWVLSRKRSCEGRLNGTYKQLEESLSHYSATSAWQIGQVHISEAVLERAKDQIRNLSLALQRGRQEFEQAAMDAVIQLISDIKTTKIRLNENKWLQGAHKIYDMVRAQQSNRPGAEIDDFGKWAKINMEAVTTNPTLAFSSSMPLPNASEIMLGALHLPSYQPYKEQFAELDRNIWYVREESVTHGMSGDLGSDVSSRGSSGEFGDGAKTASASKPPVQLTWHHLLGVALTLDALLMLYRFLHALDGAQQILSGSPIIIDYTRSSLIRNRKGEILQPDWRIKLKRTVIKTMESDFVPLSVAAAFAYLFIFLLASYSHDLISEQTLDAIGFYDNLVLPVHARYRLVNTNIATQAERSNQVELAHFERSANARFEQYQFILAEWRDWLDRFERAQCKQLLLYKERDSGIPLHCVEFEEARKKVFEKKLVFEGCSLEKVQPRLFNQYDEKLFFNSIVENSRPFIDSIRRWMANLVLMMYAFINVIIVWNLLGANTWFYLRRWNLIKQKEYFELDLRGS